MLSKASLFSTLHSLKSAQLFPLALATKTKYWGQLDSKTELHRDQSPDRMWEWCKKRATRRIISLCTFRSNQAVIRYMAGNGESLIGKMKCYRHKINSHFSVRIIMQLNMDWHHLASINKHFTHHTVFWGKSFFGKAGLLFTFMGTRLLTKPRHILLECFTLKLRKALVKCDTTLDSYALVYPSLKR